MELIDLLATSNAPVVAYLTAGAPVEGAAEGEWNNQPTWDNTGSSFDNRRTWDNWGKR